MDTRLKDKVAIVTGGARGIGAAFCEGLAAAGAKVVVSDVLDGNPVAERIAETQKQAIYVRADVTSKQSVESLVADTVKEFGTVDILVNNAGPVRRPPHQAVPGDRRGRMGSGDEGERSRHLSMRQGCGAGHDREKEGPHRQYRFGHRVQGNGEPPSLRHFEGCGGVDDALACARAGSAQDLRQCDCAGPDHERSGQDAIRTGPARPAPPA